MDPLELFETFHSPPPSPQPAIILGSPPSSKPVPVVKENGHVSNSSIQGARSPKPPVPSKRPPGSGVPQKASGAKSGKRGPKKASAQVSQPVAAA